MELSNIEKLKLINSIEVLECSANDEEMEYIIVDDNKINREILYKIGLTDENIEYECCPSDGQMDITNIGFELATWFERDKGFYDKEYE